MKLERSTRPRPIANDHHLWFSRRVFTASQRLLYLRGSTCMIVRLSSVTHVAIHALYISPLLPTAAQLCDYERRHRHGICHHEPVNQQPVHLLALSRSRRHASLDVPCAWIHLNPSTLSLVRSCYRIDSSADPGRWAEYLIRNHELGWCACSTARQIKTAKVCVAA